MQCGLSFQNLKSDNFIGERRRATIGAASMQDTLGCLEPLEPWRDRPVKIGERHLAHDETTKAGTGGGFGGMR
jgi:hypothetical protein